MSEGDSKRIGDAYRLVALLYGEHAGIVMNRRNDPPQWVASVTTGGAALSVAAGSPEKALEAFRVAVGRVAARELDAVEARAAALRELVTLADAEEARRNG